MAKIVFCEDSDVLRRLIQIALRSSGHQLFFASDGLEGLALIERVEPDLVFTDLQMPECDGLELNARLKSNPRFAKTPVILLTGASPEEARLEVDRNALAGYLLKPFLIGDLRDKVEEFSWGLTHPPPLPDPR